MKSLNLLDLFGRAKFGSLSELVAQCRLEGSAEMWKERMLESGRVATLSVLHGSEGGEMTLLGMQSKLHKVCSLPVDQTFHGELWILLLWATPGTYYNVGNRSHGSPNPLGDSFFYKPESLCELSVGNLNSSPAFATFLVVEMNKQNRRSQSELD